MDKEENIKLFFLLDKILRKTNLNFDSIPVSLKEWQTFIYLINKSFIEFEQERYLLERSLEISSREMLSLNEKLETAQALAHLGYWYYNAKTDKFIWSKETYRIMGWNPVSGVPTLDSFLKLVNKDNREELNSLIKNAMNNEKEFEYQCSINEIQNMVKWIDIKAKPYKTKESVEADPFLLSGTIMDITLQKHVEDELTTLNQKLLSARQAGRSEIASSILHNVGNVLNSVNVSITLVSELLKKSQIKNLTQAIDLLNQNSKVPNYILSDVKGRLIPDYLNKLSNVLSQEFATISTEIFNMVNFIDHIKDIINMQNNISIISGVKEKIKLVDLCEVAIQMSLIAIDKEKIHIQKDYQFTESIIIDKSKLLQILINLIQNAKESLYLCPVQPKNLSVSVINNESDEYVEIHIADNGVGIKKENLTNVFQMGFSTKKLGHGLGLHGSAIAVKELKGELVAKSEGVDKGATFILKIPKII